MLCMHFFPVPGSYNHPAGSREESEPPRRVVWQVNTTSRHELCLQWLTVEPTFLPALTTFIAFSLGLVALSVPTVPPPPPLHIQLRTLDGLGEGYGWESCPCPVQQLVFV